MHSSILIAATSLFSIANAVTGALGDAAVVSNNPIGASYVATLPNSNTTAVRGSVAAVSGAGGKGVQYSVTISGLPTSGGPFLYHIHDQPVPSNGNCTGTLAHLDPYQRGEDPLCDPSQPQTCQVGDLSGKYGTINGTGLSQQYLDLYTATLSGLGSFIGNRSIVVHFNNKTRITCANFTTISAGSPPLTGVNSTTNGTVMPTGTGSVSTMSSTATGSASKTSGGSGATATPPPPSATSSGSGPVVFLSTGALMAAIAAFVL